MTHDFPLILAAALYMVSAALLFRSIGKRSAALQNASFWLATAGGLSHAAAQYSHWFGVAEPEVGLAPLLSLCALAIIAGSALLFSLVCVRIFVFSITLFASGIILFWTSPLFRFSFVLFEQNLGTNSAFIGAFLYLRFRQLGNLILHICR